MDIQQAFKEVTGLSVEEGIEKAIEGGWNPYEPKAKFLSVYYSNGWLTNWSGENGKPLQRWLEADLLSPLFWKCIGKAMGWKKINNNCEGKFGEKNCSECGYWIKERWSYEWHRFIDALAE